jgi:hypothetical protein
MGTNRKGLLMNLEWHHPLRDGGEDQTVHNAGKELFKHLESLVKELCQNTNDAWAGGPPARIVFARELHRPRDLPGLDDILRRVRLCLVSQKDCEESVRFLQNAERALTRPSVECLRVSDHNTLGAQGDDQTKGSPWYRLVRSTGGTSKRNGQGGSHGLGKVAAIAASMANTVYYSTLAHDGGHRFVGTSLLASYDDEKGIGRQSRSFYGLERGSTVHDPLLIPPNMLRKEQGLDCLVVAHPFGEEWLEETAAAALRFMWPAIHRGRFECVVRDGAAEVSIDRESLPQRLKEHAGRTNAHLYHAAYTNPHLRQEFASPTIGTHSVHVQSGANLDNRFALFRKNGIVIEERLVRSRVRVCGAFECPNDEGNEVLRKMEPPRHDVWDPKEHPEPKTGRAADREVRDSIRKAIEKATIPASAETGSVSGLQNLLPMEGPLGGPKGGTGGNKVKPRRGTPPPASSRLPVTTRNRTKTPVRITRLVARAVGEAGGTYTLNVDHPSGAKGARIGLGIAGDSGTPVLAEIERAAEPGGRRIARSRNRLSFGPVDLVKGTTQFEVRLKDVRRISFEVYSIEPPTKGSK